MATLDKARLDQAIRAAGIPIDGVSGVQGNIRIDFKPEATAQQRTDAQAIVAAFDWSAGAQTTWDNLQARSRAKELLASAEAYEKLTRAVVLITLDEINNLRSWIASFKTEVAASTNLANLQSRVAALPNMPARTITQLKTAIEAKIDAGTADN